MEGMIFFLIVGLIVVGILIYYLLKNLKKYNLISKTETTPISMVYNGFYEVKGQIVSQGLSITSPFTETECVYYQFTVEQKKSHGKSSHWVKIIDDEKFVKFGVNDNSGTAIVDMQGADVQIKTDNNARSGFFNSADDREKAVLQKYSESNKNWIFEKSLRYTEKYLQIGDELYILGEINGKEGMNPLFRKSNMPLFVSDKSENELLGFYRLRIIGAVVGILAIAALCGWLYISLN